MSSVSYQLVICIVPGYDTQGRTWYDTRNLTDIVDTAICNSQRKNYRSKNTSNHSPHRYVSCASESRGSGYTGVRQHTKIGATKLLEVRQKDKFAHLVDAPVVRVIFLSAYSSAWRRLSSYVWAVCLDLSI